MLKIHSANLSPFSKESFQLVGGTWFLSLGDDQGYSQPCSLNECCFFIFISSARNARPFWSPVSCTETHFPSHHPCSSCSRTWNEMLHLDDLSSCFPFPTEANIYIFFHIFALLSSFQFLVSSGILQSGVLAAAEGEQVLCYWNVFTDLFFCISILGCCKSVM